MSKPGGGRGGGHKIFIEIIKICSKPDVIKSVISRKGGEKTPEDISVTLLLLSTELTDAARVCCN